MDRVTIRLATPEDLPGVEALWRELQAIQGAFRVLAVTRDMDEHFRGEFLHGVSGGASSWLVAEAGGAVIAMAYLHAERPSRVSDEEVLELSRVAVAAAWRGRGIGRLLIDEAERIARRRGARYLAARIFSGNEPAVAFWASLGFESFVDTRLRPVGPAEDGESG